MMHPQSNGPIRLFIIAFFLSFRVLWLIAFLVSVVLCGYQIFYIYKKWNQRTVIVSFAEKSTSVWEIPFPAITICPITKAQKAMLNFTDIYHKMSPNKENGLHYNLTDETYVILSLKHSILFNNQIRVILVCWSGICHMIF